MFVGTAVRCRDGSGRTKVGAEVDFKEDPALVITVEDSRVLGGAEVGGTGG